MELDALLLVVHRVHRQDAVHIPSEADTVASGCDSSGLPAPAHREHHAAVLLLDLIPALLQFVGRNVGEAGEATRLLPYSA